MKIAIIGSGGVGGYFGGKLAHSGFDVTFVARGSHLEAMRSCGLTVKSVNGDFHVPEIKAVADISELPRCDLVILGVKSWQVKDLAPSLKGILTESSTVLPLQNGIMASSELIDVLGRGPVIGGLCRIFSKIDGPGLINHFGHNPTIEFGELSDAGSERLEVIKEAFISSGVRAIIREDIEAELWRKFLFICTSGLLAVCNSNYGDIRSIAETRDMLEKLLTEIYTLAIAAGVKLEDDIVAKNMAAIDKFPADANCSLTRDVWSGRPSEIEYQNGTVVKLGEKYGVDVPVNRFIYYSILPQELRARKE